MDFHVLIVIACVFLASLFSLLFINKFFRGKTFEEVAAEKKLLAEKLYGPSKVKRQQRKVSNKKDIKKEKKQKQKESAVSKEADIDSHNDSDAQSDSPSLENSPSHKKPHVEFSEPEIIADDDGNPNNFRRSSSAGEKSKQGKRKISNSKAPGSGILINKSETVLIKETPITEPLNNFEVKQPKDSLELKKQTNNENIENKKEKDKAIVKDSKKIGKANKKEPEKTTEPPAPTLEEVPAVKEIKKTEEKQNKSNDSPKNQNKQKKEKKKVDHPASILDKLSGSDVIGVNSLMTLFNRAELNRSEIQMLIDYLLNKQQDTLANHSEWSDDIVQKLKKQLVEKDKALQEEQEASIGIQAKLRDLRTEVNTERIQFNATIKAYTEEIQAKKLEIHNLNQEIQNMTEKMNVERQQFQAKLRHEKQAGSQELLAQIQQLNERNNILQNEIVQKNTFINELQIIANASHQAVEETKGNLNEIIQQQAGQIHALEQNMNEAEKTITRLQYDLEVAKMVEKDKESSKVEIRNLQNALDSTKSELNVSRNEINDGKQRIEVLTAQIQELTNQITSVNSKCQEQSKESNELRSSLANYKAIIDENDEKIAKYEISLTELATKEDELMKQIREQKEKNNDLRMKNWKLVEALQNAETSAVRVDKKHFNNLVHQPLDTSPKDDQKVRELFERLFPEATKATAGSALSLSFDQWVEQVVATHLKQHKQRNPQKEQITNSKIQENSDSTSHNHQSSTQSTNHNHLNSSEENSNKSNGNDTSSSSKGAAQDLILQNAQLRAHIEELTAIVTRTENMLTNLETQARDQDAYWRSIVQSKQEEINSLKNSNGQAI